MSDDLIQAKHALRKQMHRTLQALPATRVLEMSVLMVARLLSQKEWLKPGSTMALFGGIQGEPDLTPLIPWLTRHQVQPVFFGFADGELIAHRVNAFEELSRGLFGVYVPLPSCPRIDEKSLDVILTPGLAFDQQRMRLGRGKGHFDKLFARCGDRAVRVGVCFECQVLPHIPAEPHDMPMHALLTESRLVRS